MLTDGEDSQTAPLITQLERAASLGIRVSFGFLAPPNSFSNAPLLAAILRTGGTYASFQTAEAIQSFLFVILSNGLTAADTPAGTTQAILPGVTVARLNAGAAAPVLFSYDAVVGEVLRFEFRSMSRQTIDGELTAPGLATPARNTSLGTVRTPASITYTASAAGPVVLAISSADTAEGVFEVSLNSSLGISACNLNNTAPIVSDPPFGNNGTSAGPTGGPVTVETTITTTVCSTDPAGAVHTQTKTLVVGGKCPKGCYHGGPAITDAPGKPPAPVATATPTRVKVNAAVGMAPEGIAVRALGLAGLAIGFAVLA